MQARKLVENTSEQCVKHLTSKAPQTSTEERQATEARGKEKSGGKSEGRGAKGWGKVEQGVRHRLVHTFLAQDGVRMVEGKPRKQGKLPQENSGQVLDERERGREGEEAGERGVEGEGGSFENADGGRHGKGSRKGRTKVREGAMALKQGSAGDSRVGGEREGGWDREREGQTDRPLSKVVENMRRAAAKLGLQRQTSLQTRGREVVCAPEGETGHDEIAEVGEGVGGLVSEVAVPVEGDVGNREEVQVEDGPDQDAQGLDGQGQALNNEAQGLQTEDGQGLALQDGHGVEDGHGVAFHTSDRGRSCECPQGAVDGVPKEKEEEEEEEEEGGKCGRREGDMRRSELKLQMGRDDARQGEGPGREGGQEREREEREERGERKGERAGPRNGDGKGRDGKIDAMLVCLGHSDGTEPGAGDGGEQVSYRSTRERSMRDTRSSSRKRSASSSAPIEVGGRGLQDTFAEKVGETDTWSGFGLRGQGQDEGDVIATEEAAVMGWDGATGRMVPLMSAAGNRGSSMRMTDQGRSFSGLKDAGAEAEKQDEEMGKDSEKVMQIDEKPWDRQVMCAQEAYSMFLKARLDLETEDEEDGLESVRKDEQEEILTKTWHGGEAKDEEMRAGHARHAVSGPPLKRARSVPDLHDRPGEMRQEASASGGKDDSAEWSGQKLLNSELLNSEERAMKSEQLLNSSPREQLLNSVERGAENPELRAETPELGAIGPVAEDSIESQRGSDIPRETLRNFVGGIGDGTLSSEGEDHDVAGAADGSSLHLCSGQGSGEEEEEEEEEEIGRV